MLRLWFSTHPNAYFFTVRNANDDGYFMVMLLVSHDLGTVVNNRGLLRHY